MSAEAERKTENLPEWKREEVADLVETIESYDSVGVVNIAGIPSRQLQAMRADLWPDTELRVSRNTLLVRALEEVDEGVEDLTEHVAGQVGVCTPQPDRDALLDVPLDAPVRAEQCTKEPASHLLAPAHDGVGNLELLVDETGSLGD